MIRIDGNVRLIGDHLVLHIDRTAQFRRERVGGLFSKRIYRFSCKIETQEFRYKGSWTKKEFQSLKRQQKKTPVPLTTENISERTWWTFQDTIFWEDFSASEIHNKRRSGLDVTAEIKAIFSEGARTDIDISGNVYHLNCGLGRRRVQQGNFLTEHQLKSLKAKQRENPAPVLTENENKRVLWMFQNRFYWAEDDLSELEVKGNIVEQVQKRETELRIELDKVKQALFSLPGPMDEVANVQIRVLMRRQQKIDRALKVIEQGQYGFCEHCGEQIQLERLKALPDATRCTSCSWRY